MTYCIYSYDFLTELQKSLSSFIFSIFAEQKWDLASGQLQSSRLWLTNMAAALAHCNLCDLCLTCWLHSAILHIAVIWLLPFLLNVNFRLVLFAKTNSTCDVGWHFDRISLNAHIPLNFSLYLQALLLLRYFWNKRNSVKIN